MDISKWFDDGTYSDLAIKLSDGTELKLHKIVLCQENEYFRKLCGPGSRFAESKQSTIELVDDDPIALRNVLRAIYHLDFDVDFAHTPAWKFYLNVRVTADKYLVPKVSELADQRFRLFTLMKHNADTIFDVIESIDNEMSYDESLVELAEKMRKDNLGKLLENDRFREKLQSGGTEALWQVIDSLAFAGGMKKKRHHLCDHHMGEVFLEPSHGSKAVEACPFCVQATRTFNSHFHGSIATQYEEDIVCVHE